MDRLWAPWRRRFVRRRRLKGCIFCSKPRARADAANLVLRRGRTAFSMLNLYPYNNGHVLVAPYRHVADPRDLTGPEREELDALVRAALDRLERVLRPDGFNVGYNVGRVAGAGYEGHVHAHVVPRWKGDTNFMPVLSGTKVMSESLAELRRSLLA